MECISDEYADGSDSVFEKAFDYVYDIMFDPKLENEVFKKDFVEQEKTNTNTKYGLTFSHRIKKKNALKIAFTNGISNRYGFDYTSIILAYSFLWFDK